MAVLQIERIGEIQEGDKPQMGPRRAAPLLIQVGKAHFIEITRDAARELIDRLDAYLRENG